MEQTGSVGASSGRDDAGTTPPPADPATDLATDLVTDPAADPAPGAPWRRVALRVALAVLALLLVLVAWVGLRAWQAANALQEARAWLDGVELDARGFETVGKDLTGLQASTSRAASAASDPLWRAAEGLPWAGDQLEAVRVVATSLDAVVTDALPAVTDLRALLDGGVRDEDGPFDVQALRRVATRVETAAATAATARADVDTLDPDALVGRLAGPVREVQDALAHIDGTLAPAAGIAPALPGMLGADGPRTYLVLALNTAELRAAGGIVGTVIAVRADAGALSIVDRKATLDLWALKDPVLPLTDEELAAWGPRLGRWVQNSVLTPDFPRTAELVAARWAHDGGGEVDGVIATDTLAVGELIGATGPVPDPDGGTLEADRLVDALLRQPYIKHADPALADAYFGDVAENVMDAIGEGRGDPEDLLSAARRTVDERRVRIWSAHPDEQERIAATVAGGAYTSSDLFADEPGLFLDDATQGKVGAYLTTDVTFRDARCTGPDPSVDVVLRLDYRPPPAVAMLGVFVTGVPGPDVPLGTLLTHVSVWSTVGGPPLPVTRDGQPATGEVERVAGRTVLQLPSRLAPGQSEEYVVTVPLHDGAVTLWTTPTLTAPGSAGYTCP
ncbi:conserved hypothetical protein [Cellulomonas flavigena DSM 20109]|uniref:DUF4012 domain-containing protein n=1 Tax=Cellulomonas flavigena (strain ATCC 482 / DSM 20109 / BCRC 11376 / JCM 18109 / NBRC 3775 / NCIMB 8073 / NRS 134) TaxID=446466 RepID=D5UJF6_CELFN|nr:DUF4012 domain-containing protein [Cellulomonas flavigena]ADG73679.1 conserved hypothetical protein [Cellulomonas flavigena DSM 20109]